MLIPASLLPHTTSGVSRFSSRHGLLLAALWLTACNSQAPSGQPAAPQGAAPPAPPPPEVIVVKVAPETVALTREMVGRLASSRVAQVRARVAGIILRQDYTEGTDVRAGAVLFQIDPAPLKTTLLAQEAALLKAQVDAQNASDIARRYTDLNSKGLISRQDLDTAVAAQRSTEAAVRIAEANVEAAKLDLSYATVRAPIDGRAGRAEVNEGALVGQGETTVLTSIEQIDPIHVNFSQSLAEFEQLQQGALGSGGNRRISVDVLLQNGEAYAHKGSLDFADLAVDPGTGAVSLRAVIPNPKRRLLPGTFVKLRITTGQLQGVYKVPQAAVQRDNGGAYVLIVDGAGLVQTARVELRTMTTSDWVVSGQLSEGSQVIVSGLQKVRPGAPARAVLAGEKPAGGPPGQAQGQGQGQGQGKPQ